MTATPPPPHPLKMMMMSSSSNVNKFSSSDASSSAIRIKHHRHSTTGDWMIPANLTYYTPQHKRYSTSAAAGATQPVVRLAAEKRSPVNKNVQQINSEEEASVLSRYPFHGNRALPSSRGEQEKEPEEMAKKHPQRWSLIDVNNNRMDEGEVDGMLQPAAARVGSECRLQVAQRTVLLRGGRIAGGMGIGGLIASPIRGSIRPKRQLTAIRSHSSNSKIHYKSPPVKRYSNVYDYTYMSDPSLNAIYEDSDSQ